MSDDELWRWFAANRDLLETAYLAGEQPWQQSGVGLRSRRDYAYWEALRRPIAECVERPGAFLDIGCANGYLLECVLRWTAERGVGIEPYGLDLSAKLVTLARERLPTYADNLFVGNAWDWTPPQTFDYVRTELVYVPSALQAVFVSRLLDEFVAPGGKLLAAEYRGHESVTSEPTIDRDLARLDFQVESVRGGMWEGVEQTRIAVVGARRHPRVAAPTSQQ